MHDSLVRDARVTPFNIGQRIEPTDFTLLEARPLAAGFGEGGMHAIERILYWSDGHPYLTQRLCQAVAEVGRCDNGAVDRAVARLFFHESAREEETNLSFVQRRLLEGGDDVTALLELYRRTRRREVKEEAGSPLVAILKLSGIVRSVRGQLRVRNRIYARVFDEAWIEPKHPRWRAAAAAGGVLARAPAHRTAFFTVTSDNGTLGHAVMSRLLGPAAGVAWSAATVLVFLSAMSAMIFLGPRVYAAMAADGFLPKFLRASPEGHPPRAAVLLQGALTLVIIFTQGLRETLGQVGAILVLFAALVALGLVVARIRGMKPTPSKRAVVAAVIYVVSSAWMFWKGFGDQPRTLLWVAGVAVIGDHRLGAVARRAPCLQSRPDLISLRAPPRRAGCARDRPRWTRRRAGSTCRRSGSRSAPAATPRDSR